MKIQYQEHVLKVKIRGNPTKKEVGDFLNDAVVGAAVYTGDYVLEITGVSRKTLDSIILKKKILLEK